MRLHQKDSLVKRDAPKMSPPKKNKKNERNDEPVRSHIAWRSKASSSSAYKFRQFGKDHEKTFRGIRVMVEWRGKRVRGRRVRRGGQVTCVKGRGLIGGVQGGEFIGRGGNGGCDKICHVGKGGKHPRFIWRGNYGFSCKSWRIIQV